MRSGVEMRIWICFSMVRDFFIGTVHKCIALYCICICNGEGLGVYRGCIYMVCSFEVEVKRNELFFCWDHRWSSDGNFGGGMAGFICFGFDQSPHGALHSIVRGVCLQHCTAYPGLCTSVYYFCILLFLAWLTTHHFLGSEVGWGRMERRGWVHH